MGRVEAMAEVFLFLRVQRLDADEWRIPHDDVETGVTHDPREDAGPHNGMHLSKLFAKDGSSCSIFLDQAVAQHNPFVEADADSQIPGCGLGEPLATASHGFGAYINPVQTINKTS
jgi:hypothetical protein